jgi:hypothetical protein
VVVRPQVATHARAARLVRVARLVQVGRMGRRAVRLARVRLPVQAAARPRAAIRAPLPRLARVARLLVPVGPMGRADRLARLAQAEDRARSGLIRRDPVQAGRLGRIGPGQARAGPQGRIGPDRVRVGQLAMERVGVRLGPVTGTGRVEARKGPTVVKAGLPPIVTVVTKVVPCARAVSRGHRNELTGHGSRAAASGPVATTTARRNDRGRPGRRAARRGRSAPKGPTAPPSGQAVARRDPALGTMPGRTRRAEARRVPPSAGQRARVVQPRGR